MKRNLVALSSVVFFAVACGAPIGPRDLVEPEDIETTGKEDSALSAAKAAVGKRVFTQSNSAIQNELFVYTRTANGGLAGPEIFGTGGKGTDAGLGSQGAVALSSDGSFVAVVNAGSNDVSIFKVGRQTITLTDKKASGGMKPVSVAISGPLLYVLNAGEGGNVSGFSLDRKGRLSALPRGVRALVNPAAGAAQISFTPANDALVVTEKATNCVDVFPLAYDGTPGVGSCTASAGQTPFGFAFAPPVFDYYGQQYDRLLVSEAFGGAALASAVSSYFVVAGQIIGASASVATLQTAACWVAIARKKFAFTTNTASNSVTAYRVGLYADLTRTESTTLPEGTKPTEIAATSKGNLLDVLGSGTHDLTSFRVKENGGLDRVSTIAGLPAFAVGLASE